MAWKQLIKPNIKINETAGWCLQYARRVFGRPAVEPTAWAAWQASKFKHQDRKFPSGVAVPVWFNWWGDVGSGRYQYGHVAVRMPDGKVWSSPLTGNGRAWFNSVDDLVRAFGGGMKYVGWSEDISGARVAVNEGGTNMKLNLATARQLAETVLGREGSMQGKHDADLKKHHVGKEITVQYLNSLYDSAEAKNFRKRKAASTAKPSTVKATTLKAGLYEVK
jgi:hypothetical protein